MPSYKQKKQRLRQLVKQQEQQRIKKIQKGGHQFVDSDEFKRQQKHYKHYVHLETDYSEILKLQEMKKLDINGCQVYALAEPEGAYLVKDFVGLREQYLVGFQALNEYIFRPYRTNLDGTNGLYHENASDDKNETAQKIEQQKQQVKGKLINIQLQNQKILQGVDPSNMHAKYHFNQKIRMSNLGYQYDWPNRTYPATSVSIPQTITKLTKKASKLYQAIRKQPITYHGEAVIVNYYKNKDYMTGHLDDGEEDQVNPIFSFCFGLSCVFLIGYPVRAKKPHAIRLDAGDLLIMSGYSRGCYHGVPRIIQNSYDSQKLLTNNLQQAQNTREQIEKMIETRKQELKHAQNIDKKYLNHFDHVSNYFMEHRLNINVRQVWVRKDQKKTIEQIKQELKIVQHKETLGQKTQDGRSESKQMIKQQNL